MPMSEISPPLVLGEGEASKGGPSPGGGFGSEQAISLGQTLERLANQYFSGVPGAAIDPKLGSAGAVPVMAGPLPVPSTAPPSGVLPNALSVGAGGMSPGSGWTPPTPGFLQQMPLASGPLPKESDLRTLPAMLSEGLGISSPVALAGGLEPSSHGAPYFLELAGLPKATPASSPVQSVPAGEARPAFGANGAPSGVPTHGGLPGSGAGALLPVAGAPAEARLASGDLPVGSTGGFSPSSRGNPHDAQGLSQPTDRVEFERNVRSGDTFSPAGLDRGSRRLFDPLSIKRDFPILRERIHNKELVWLDNAATTQKPQVVIDRISHFYEHESSNIHRAAHTLAARSTDAYEGARETTRRFLNAPSVNEIIFVRGTTEAINLVAQTWGRRYLNTGDEVVISWLEHHANIVPWQQICIERGARLRVAPVDEQGQVLLYDYERLLGPRTKFVSLSQVSNALGTIVPVTEMVAMAHRHGAKVLVDGAQAVSHMRVDVQAIDSDFYVFSGHKIFGPTGIGALFGKADVLESMPPWQGGGNMIRDVTFEKTQFQQAPARFEAGTPNIADAVGLGAALDYVSSLGLENISRYEHDLLLYATERLLRVPGLRLFGTAPDKAGVLSFVVGGLKTEEIGVALDREGIAVRAGHHCAQPILRRFGVETTVRASLAPYNTCDDIDALVSALLRMKASSY